MIILVGPSASGKTEVGKVLESEYKIKKLVTYTTREMRENEIDGLSYHFISEKEFLEMKNDNLFFETVYYSNCYYGTKLSDIKDDTYVILEPNGLVKYKNSDIFNVSFYFDVPEEVCKLRMKQRLDKKIDIINRLKRDSIVFKDASKLVDYVISDYNNSIRGLAKYIN